MPITVRVPAVLRRLTGGQDELEADGATVAEVFDRVARQYDGFRKKVLLDNGELRPFLNVFVNGEDVRFAADLRTSVKEGDEVSIVPSVAGGR
jgi:molybdopterin synthase sulfur carrier subunit